MKITIGETEMDIKRLSDTIYNENSDIDGTESIEVAMIYTGSIAELNKTITASFTGEFSVTDNNGTVKTYTNFVFANIRQQSSDSLNETTLQFTSK